MKAKMVWLIAYLTAITVFLASCSTSAVYLRHPKTGEVVKCGPYYSGGVHASAAALHEAKCTDDYRAQGYERVPTPQGEPK